MSELSRMPRGLLPAARWAAGRALAAAWLMLAAPAGFASAAQESRLNINVSLKGFTFITDLSAEPGAASGSIELNWTEPGHNMTTPPLSYEIAVSSLAQISNSGEFDAALPLSAFSPSAPPAYGSPGAAAGFAVTGLTPGVTYYFAIRARDSDSPALRGPWLRNPAQGWNLENAARAAFTPGPPDPVADLQAAPSFNLGEIALSWTAPAQPNGVPMSSYALVYSSLSVADLGGDTEAWFNLATATRVAFAPVKPAGSPETLAVTGLEDDIVYYFGLKSIDHVGAVSAIDARAAGVVTQASATVRSTINLSASPGAVSGSVDLSWIEPFSAGLVPPLQYIVKASSVSNIDDDAQFDAAAPLSAFSPSTPPAPGPGGDAAVFTVTGLIPGVTYYFAIRERDSGAPPFETRWKRNGQVSVNNFAPAHFVPNDPEPITNLTALPGAAAGGISLSWTAPLNTNFVPMSHYELRYASFSIAELSGDTTAWFALAPHAAVLPAQTPGTLVTHTIGGLYPLTTFYFAIKSADVRGAVSPIDARAAANDQAFTRPHNEPPATPQNLAAAAGLKRATLSWTDLSPAQKGLAFGFYQLYRSTEETGGFVTIATTTATSFLDRPLKAFTTYYYRVSARQPPGGLESVIGSTVSALPFNAAPMEPFGLRVSHSSETLSVSWSTTTRYADGTPFDDPAAPDPDELLGYRVFRSTSFCQTDLAQMSSQTFATPAFSTHTGGIAYFYQIKSFNTLGHSTATLVLSTLGDMHFFFDGCGSALQLPESVAKALNAENNGLGADIQLARRARPEDTGGSVMQSVEIKPMLDGASELKSFFLPKPVRISLRYETVGGAPVPAGGNAPAAGVPASEAAKHLGMFWHNGAEFQKLYGKVDTLQQTVSVDTPNLGVFQIRTLLRSEGAVFDLSNLSSRVITPNDDGKNDQAIFTYDPGPNNVVPEGKIYDLQGRFVAQMTFGLVPNTLTWDGKMGGRPVSSGVYVYQIKGDGKTFNGTIVVAR